MNVPTEVELLRFTLVFPPALEQRIVALLLERDERLPGFTILGGDGHGADFASATVRERVRGSVGRRLLTVVLPAVAVAPLVEELRAALPDPHVIWWIEPVLAFGRLA